VQVDVVAGIDHDRHVTGRDRADEAAQELPGADATGERDDLHDEGA
jgi:hypothetical protein